MKTSQDPRHKARIKTMQELFAWNFRPENKIKPDKQSLPSSDGESEESENQKLNETSKQIIQNLNKIDTHIQDAAPTWPIEKINKIDLAILRLAVYELIIEPKNPSKVVVDEAIELAKEYGADSSASFINGALGKLISDYKIQA